MATAVFTPVDRDLFKRRVAAAGYPVALVRERGGVLRAFVATSVNWAESRAVRAEIIQSLPNRPGEAVLIALVNGREEQVGVVKLPRVICDGVAVRLSTGTIFRDVRRSSATGEYWTGVLVTPGPGYPAKYLPGMRLVFHGSGVQEILDAERN